LSRENCCDMDKRSEPRFQVQSAVRIAAIDQPEQVSTAVLLDVSGAGMKLIADSRWPVGACVVVEMENHLVVARVRNVAARGPKFAVGAERIYSVLKHTLPAGASRAVWHNILIAEMGDSPRPPVVEPAVVEPEAVAPRVVAPEIAAPAVIAKAPASDLKVPAVEKRAQHAADEPVPQAARPTEAAPPAPEVKEEAARLAPREVPAVQRESVPVFREQMQPAQASEEDGPPMAPAFPTVPSAAQPGLVLRTPTLVPQFGPAYGMAPTADLLTPISTMPDVPPPAPQEKPRWVVPTGVAAGLLALVLLAFYYGPFRPRASSAPRTGATRTTAAPLTIPSVTEAPDGAPTASTPANGKAATSAAPAASVSAPPANTHAPSSAASAPAPSIPPAPAKAPGRAPAAQPTLAKAVAPAQPTPPAPVTGRTPSTVAPVASAPSAGVRRATVKASATNWISVCSDGKPTFAKLLMAGESLDVSFQRTAVVRVGNAAAAEIDLDGKSVGPLGPAGTVKILQISAAGVSALPPNTSPETECRPVQAAAKP
jgi:hypothetical protein